MINGTLYITNSVTIADGGTKYLIAHDSDGIEISILLAQHFIEEYFDSSEVPGRLHINDKAIKVRSKKEAELIQILKGSVIKEDSHEISFKSAYQKIEKLTNLASACDLGPEYGTAYLIKLIIEFVESDEYEKIALKFNAKNHLDKTKPDSIHSYNE